MLYLFFFLIVTFGLTLAIILIPILGITIVISAINGANELKSACDQAADIPVAGDCEPTTTIARYCDVCGTKFDERSNFCGNCGSQRVRASIEDEPVRTPPPPVQQVVPTPLPTTKLETNTQLTVEKAKPEWYKSPLTYIITGVVAAIVVLLVMLIPSDKSASGEEFDEPMDREYAQTTICYKGKVANADIVMRLDIEGNAIVGEYYYTRVNKPLLLIGNVQGDVYELLEYADDENTGTFKMSLDDVGGLSGTWFNGNKTFKVKLQQSDEAYQLNRFSGMSTSDIAEEGKRLFAKKDYKNAFDYFAAAAERGDHYASIKIGSMYEYGQYVEQNYEKAFYWFMEAAREGYAEAEYYVGDMYEYGKGVEKNLTLALEWYSKAAAQGNAGAQKRVDYLK